MAAPKWRCNGHALTRFVWVSDGFLLLVAVGYLLDGEGVVGWFLLAAAVHEIGHMVAIALCGGRITHFALTCAGGKMRYHLPCEMPWQRACIAAMGPLFGIVLALCTHGVLAGASLMLSLFNLLPVPPLDGSLVVAALLPSHALQRAIAVLATVAVLALGVVVAWQAHGFGVLLIGTILAVGQFPRRRT